jgi:hypothetical protein
LGNIPKSSFLGIGNISLKTQLLGVKNVILDKVFCVFCIKNIVTGTGIYKPEFIGFDLEQFGAAAVYSEGLQA